MIDSNQLVEYAKQPELALRKLKELLCLLESDDETEQVCATDLLENCGAPSRSDIPFLCQQLVSSSSSRVYWSSTLLGRLGPTGGEQSERSNIQSQLCNVIDNETIEPSARERAAWAIGELGSIKGSSRDVLEKHLATASPRLKRLLEAALAM